MWTFHEVDKSLCIIYVPIGATAAYAQAKGWKDFLNISESGTDVEQLVDFSVRVFGRENQMVLQGLSVGDKIDIYSLAQVCNPCDTRNLTQLTANQTIFFVNPSATVYLWG